MRYALITLHWLGILFIAHALMMIGADEITSLERGGLTIRSLRQVLTLYGADPSPWLAAYSPASISHASAWLMAWPAWGVLVVTGAAILVVCNRLES